MLLSDCTWHAVIKWTIHPALPFTNSLRGDVPAVLPVHGEPDSASCTCFDSSSAHLKLLCRSRFLPPPLWRYEIMRRMSGCSSSARVESQSTQIHFEPQGWMSRKHIKPFFTSSFFTYFKHLIVHLVLNTASGFKCFWSVSFFL